MISAIATVGAENTIAIQYDASNNAIYVGEAKPGTAQSASGWRIKYLSYDASNNCTDIEWAEGSNEFRFVWDNRTTYSYS